MKKIKVLALLALLAVSPLLLGAGTGGFPSQPKFKRATINSVGMGLPVCDSLGPPFDDPALCATFSLYASNSTNNTGTAASGMARFVNATTHANIIIDGNGISGMRLARSGGLRWNVKQNGDAESGFGNTGSNFEIQGFNDAGSHLSYPFKIIRSNSEIQIAGNFISTATCQAGYSRATPNACIKDQTGTSSTALTLDACTTVARPNSAARALIVRVSTTLRASNSAGAKSSAVASWATNACSTTFKPIVAASAYEFTALAGLEELANDSALMIVNVDGSGNIYLKFTDDASNFAVAAFQIVGYLD